jgi:hypothetical protein
VNGSWGGTQADDQGGSTGFAIMAQFLIAIDTDDRSFQKLQQKEAAYQP